MNSRILQSLSCVVCKSDISFHSISSDQVQCANCQQTFPVVNGIPIMINETESIFTFSDFTTHQNLFFDISKKGSIISTISRIMPSIGGNNLGKKNFTFLEMLLSEKPGNARVLVIGGSIVGEGMSEFVKSSKLDIVEGDVSFGPQTKIVFDAHSIPYASETFDCVVIQAVLEHVISSSTCVAEVFRVLKPNGIVYAETPFMQQVHGGPYDFTRYTRSGHRKLFQHFEEIKSGATAGSATAFAWSYQYLLLALLGHSRTLRLMIKFFARITGFWIKYLDKLTGFNKYDFDGASGFFFMGKKATVSISDKELIRYYSKR